MMFFPPAPKPTVPQQPSTEETGQPLTTEDRPETVPAAVEKPTETISALPESAIDEQFEEAPDVKEDTITLSNGLAQFEFSNRGAVLKRVVLISNKVVLHKDVDLFYGEMRPGEYPFAISSEEDKKLRLAQYPFELVSREKLNLVYACERGDLRITKEYTILPNDYVVNLKITFENNTDQKTTVEGYTMGAGAIFPIVPIDSRPYYQYLISADGKPTKIKAKPETAFTKSPSDVKWAVVMNRYFSIIASPAGQNIAQITGGGQQITGYDFPEENNKNKSNRNYYPLRLGVRSFNVAPHSERSHKFSLYIGPKEFDRLKKLGFDINTARTSFIGAPMLKFLKWSYKIIPNYGVAIIVLTVLIKILLYPLDQKSYKSMKEMQHIQPLITQLREKHKDDQRKLQQETMKLYKEHKVNPLGGCLPLLLQMPILFAMFAMLQNAVELWGAPFTLWIRDLSQPDSLIKFKQSILMFDRLNVLPILMLISFYFQQKISSVSGKQDSQQKMMGNMMLVVFGFIFYNMPSGLNLYFIVSTVLRTLQQYLVQKKK